LISDVYPKAEYEIDAKTKLVTNKRADVKELQPIYVTPSVAFNYMVDHIFLIVHDEAGAGKEAIFLLPYRPF
jgi:acetoacetate decarboxylase